MKGFVLQIFKYVNKNVIAPNPFMGSMPRHSNRDISYSVGVEKEKNRLFE